MAVTIETEPTFRRGRAVRLFETDEYGTPATVGTNRRMDVSPDGTRFLMFKKATGADGSAREPEIILVQNWFDELRRRVPTN